MATRKIVGESRLVMAMRQIPEATEKELDAELDVCAQLVARRARFKARKFRTLLANGIQVSTPTKLVHEIAPSANYAVPQEEGVKPGGKGLPRFSDPEAADIIAWLRTTAFRGQAKPRANSMAAVRRELELRDRYEGLAWHIRHKGVKPGPYMKPAFDELAPVIASRLQAAAAGATQRAAGGATA
ncbi:hypothetical protein [Ramlibacter sp.]|uniref:hypothetical protein n=1 Tax=Ramlibacter sp. TaxID=1917967 RepID=UPI003D0CC104